MTLSFTQGNLLDAEAEALVNTVNTVGVMGKGIALMFKERFPENFRIYQAACKAGTLDVGQMLVTSPNQLDGPKWVINFPTKRHWRQPSRLEWVEAGLQDLKRVVQEHGIRSVALPPLGAGNGGLQWAEVRQRIEDALGSLNSVRVLVYEPTPEYQNVAKATGVERLTPPRALVAELVRRYSILGIECSLLEVHKLAYLLERRVAALGLPGLGLQFEAAQYGPYAQPLSHLLNRLDGSYLHSDKRLGDAKPFDLIRFEDSRRGYVAAYLTTPEAAPYRPALEQTTALIDGFESPLGMELLATVDWLLHDGVAATTGAVLDALRQWPGGPGSAERKLRLFDARAVGLALDQLRAKGHGQEEIA